MMGVGAKAKRALIVAGKAMDARPGLSQDAVRLALSVVATVGYTVRIRRLTTLRWAPRERRWHHRWPEGRVNDVRWWRSAHAWATHGGMYDVDDLLWRHYRPTSGDVVMDVGAGTGGETFRLSPMVGAAGRVIAIEAAPGPYARLVELCRINGFDNVETYQVAMAGEPGVLTMSDTDDWVAGNVFESGSVEVPAVTLDGFCAEHGVDRIDWLKMNIEGAEKDVVRAMRTMAPRIRHLTVSCHDFLGTEWGRSKAAVTASLRELGFEVVEHGGPDPVMADYVHAWRPDEVATPDVAHGAS